MCLPGRVRAGSVRPNPVPPPLHARDAPSGVLEASRCRAMHRPADEGERSQKNSSPCQGPQSSGIAYVAPLLRLYAAPLVFASTCASAAALSAVSGWAAVYASATSSHARLRALVPTA